MTGGRMTLPKSGMAGLAITYLLALSGAMGAMEANETNVTMGTCESTDCEAPMMLKDSPAACAKAMCVKNTDECCKQAQSPTGSESQANETNVTMGTCEGSDCDGSMMLKDSPAACAKAMCVKNTEECCKQAPVKGTCKSADCSGSMVIKDSPALCAEAMCKKNTTECCKQANSDACTDGGTSQCACGDSSDGFFCAEGKVCASGQCEAPVMGTCKPADCSGSMMIKDSPAACAEAMCKKNTTECCKQANSDACTDGGTSQCTCGDNSDGFFCAEGKVCTSEQCEAPPPTVVVTIVVQNVNYDLLVANDVARAAFVQAIIDAIVSVSGVDAANIKVILAQGSVKVETRITAPSGTTIAALETTMTDDTTLASLIVTNVKAVADINNLMDPGTGEITASAPVVTTADVPTIDPNLEANGAPTLLPSIWTLPVALVAAAVLYG